MLPSGIRLPTDADVARGGLSRRQRVQIQTSLTWTGPTVGGTCLKTNMWLYSVDETGRRGIVLLSLDADRAAVWPPLRAVFELPYRWSRVSILLRHSPP